MPRLLAAALLLIVPACDTTPAEPTVAIEEAWVSLPAIPGRPGAAYFTLRSNNDPTKLTAISSPRVERVELHDSRSEGGVSRMIHIPEASFEDGTLRFEPGGKHAMLFGIDPSVQAGGTIPLTFTFEPAPPVTVEAQVRAPGDVHGGH